MDLALARKIIQEQADYLKTTEFHLYTDNYESSINGDDIDEVVVSDIKASRYGIDSSKIYVDDESSFGGEGEGETYWKIYKIDHPVHGLGYIKYQGQYDSWNGVEWDDPNMVTPVQVMVTQYKDL